MPLHKVEKSEWIGSIAARHGHKSWDLVWNHPRNSTLRKKRDPNLLVEGDLVWVPEVELKHEEAATETRHRYRLERQKDKLVLRFREVKAYIDLFGPIPYVLKVGAEKKKGSITDEDHVVEVPLSIDLEQGALLLAGEDYELHIGALDPIERTSGMQARLVNTGWEPGEVDNVVGQRTEAGTRAFQTHYQLKIDGIIGSQTRGKMKEVYGC
jgi:hypothetical protein